MKAKSYQDRKVGNINLRFEGHRKSDINIGDVNKGLQNLHLQGLRRSNTVRETSSNNYNSDFDEQEEFEKELYRPVKMLRSKKLHEL